ncbi:MAG: hypothetical protein ABR860_07975, partial [Terracidiphilus sp.]
MNQTGTSPRTHSRPRNDGKAITDPMTNEMINAMVRHTVGPKSMKGRLFSRFTLALFAFACAAVAVLPAAAQQARPALNITGYVIDAELDTTAHHLTATTVVSFTAPANLDVVNFGFHPALKVTKITDESGKLLEGERTADGSIRVTASAP